MRVRPVRTSGQRRGSSGGRTRRCSETATRTRQDGGHQYRRLPGSAAKSPRYSGTYSFAAPASAFAEARRTSVGTPHGVPRADEPFRLGTDELSYSFVETYERIKTNARNGRC